MITGNKGEWSEAYVLLRLLAQGRIYAANENLEQIDDMFAKIKADFGHLDIMVNNAAIVLRAPFLEISVEDWDRTMTTNSRGYFYCGQSAAKLMLNNENGGICRN